MKRIVMMFALTALLVVALSMSAFSASAAPRQCQIGDNDRGCRTTDNEDTRNPNDQIATIGKSQPHQCVEQGNSGKCRR